MTTCPAVEWLEDQFNQEWEQHGRVDTVPDILAIFDREEVRLWTVNGKGNRGNYMMTLKQG